MKKFVSVLTVVILLVSILTVPTLAFKDNLNMGDVPKTADAITIDAVKDAVYDKGLKTHISRMVDGVEANPTTTTADVWLLWSDGFLYVYGEVKTSVIPALDEDLQTNQSWMIDSLEVFLDPTNENTDNTNTQQYRVDYTGYCSIQFQADGTNSYGNRDAGKGFVEGAGKKIDTGYSVEMKIINPLIKAGQLGFLYQVNDMHEDGTRTCLFQDGGEGQSWASDKYDYVTLVDTTVTGVEVVEVVPVEAAPVEAAAADTAASAPTATAAPQTGDAGMILAIFALLASASVLVFKTKKNRV